MQETVVEDKGIACVQRGINYGLVFQVLIENPVAEAVFILYGGMVQCTSMGAGYHFQAAIFQGGVFQGDPGGIFRCTAPIGPVPDAGAMVRIWRFPALS